jgi:predicted transcriptional regulator
MPAWLLSIHPDRLEALIAGSKTWEYRRRNVRLDRGDVVVFYATAPISKPTAWAYVRDVRLSSDVTAVVSEQDPTEAQVAVAYLAGAPSASALAFEGFRRLPNCTLNAIGVAHAPQSYSRVEDSVIEHLCNS